MYHRAQSAGQSKVDARSGAENPHNSRAACQPLKPLTVHSVLVFIFLKGGGGSLKLLISAEKSANELFH